MIGDKVGKYNVLHCIYRQQNSQSLCETLFMDYTHQLFKLLGLITKLDAR